MWLCSATTEKHRHLMAFSCLTSGTRIATLNCRNTFSELFAIEQFPDNSHKDNEDMADFIEGYTVRGEAVR